MAELTKQQSIKLLGLNKFRISGASTARSRNLTERKSLNLSVNVPEENRYSDNSKPKYPQSQNFKRALYKIGALQKDDLKFTFQPEEVDHKTFRSRRMSSLRQKYFKQRAAEDKSCPYNDDYIDQAALGCWSYGQSNTNKGVWRKYKDNLNRLNFDTLKLLSKKKVY